MWGCAPNHDECTERLYTGPPAGRPQDLRAVPNRANDLLAHFRTSGAVLPRVPRPANANRPERSSRCTTTYKPASPVLPKPFRPRPTSPSCRSGRPRRPTAAPADQRVGIMASLSNVRVLRPSWRACLWPVQRTRRGQCRRAFTVDRSRRWRLALAKRRDQLAVRTDEVDSVAGYQSGVAARAQALRPVRPNDGDDARLGRQFHHSQSI